MESPLFYQAVIFGVVTVIVGLLLSSIFSNLKPELPKECEEWDKYYIMEVTFFFSGVILRYALEYTEIKNYLI
jgi:hypothetical protein